MIGLNNEPVSSKKEYEIARLNAKCNHLQGLCDSFQKVIKQADEDIQTLHSKGHRLALELECLLNDTRDTAIQSKWWDSAHEALEDWRNRK